MYNFKDLIRSDYNRYTGGKKLDFIHRHRLFGYRYTKVLRKAQYWKGKNKLVFLFYALRIHILQLRYGFMIPIEAKIGKGLYIGHVGTITVNSQAKIGDNVNLAPNVVIGQTNRGKNAGVPAIGNKVWIGAGAVIVGKIIIGDDVLIAPNSYVNFDVPSHSIVIGNPGVIHHRENATEDYISNPQ